MTKHAIVLGLDGASWNVLEPFIMKGVLPNFGKLLENSCYGPLKSTIPPVSIPAWKCYSTGKNPGKLGVYNLLMMDVNNRRLKAPASGDFKSPEIWDYLGDAGLKSCVYNLFGTQPARKIWGCLISDVPNERGFYPAELQTEIENRFGPLYCEVNFINDRDGTYKKVLEDVKKNFDVAKYLIEKYDPEFTHFSISHTDGIQHFFWGDMERNDVHFGNYIENFWVELDKLLGDFINYLKIKYSENYFLFIMSDHGFENVEYRFNIGDWLVRKGLLKLNKKGKSLRLSLFLRDRFQIINPLMEAATAIVRRVSGTGNKRRGVQEMLIASMVYEKSIDWRESAVIPLTGECLYVNRKAASHTENFTSRLINEIGLIRNPQNDLMAREVVNGKELYRNESAPDILILPRNTEVYNAPLLRTMWSNPIPNRWTGRHALYGTLIMYGPGIKESHRLEGTTLYDIAPTILSIFGLPVSDDMDGKVILDAFDSSGALNKRQEKKS